MPTYPCGKFLNSTLSVGELIDVLSKFDKDAPVVLTYEGCEQGVDEDSILFDRGCVIIDAEEGNPFWSCEWQARQAAATAPPSPSSTDSPDRPHAR